MTGKVFISWSGGKDSCLAAYQAKASGLEISYLLNMVTEDGERSWTHGLSAELLQKQAEAVGIPLVQKQTTLADYEARFKNVLLELKRQGVSGGVFGDIDIEEHREWVTRVCHAVEITPYLPLWGQRQELILRGFIKMGFEAVVVTARADLFGEEWLGRRVDRSFVQDLAKLKETNNITLCGEAGEYHTFVVDGPLFRQKIGLVETSKVCRDGYWFLEITKSSLGPR